MYLSFGPKSQLGKIQVLVHRAGARAEVQISNKLAGGALLLVHRQH